jgi:lipoate-protein ligase A
VASDTDAVALRLISTPAVADPVLDAAISHALMLRVASGELPDTLRISRPGPSVAFGKRDVISPGYPAATAAASENGFEPVERLSGGRAAAFHEQTIHLSHTIHDPNPRQRVTQRFQQTAEACARAFRALGVEAHVGELPGEYCPGSHSVNARHRLKLMGVGQRIVRNAAQIGTVVVVSESSRIRAVLEPVYSALDLDWRPETTGSLADELPAIAWEEARAAIEREYAASHDMNPGELDERTLALAEELVPERRPRVG